MSENEKPRPVVPIRPGAEVPPEIGPSFPPAAPRQQEIQQVAQTEPAPRAAPANHLPDAEPRRYLLENIKLFWVLIGAIAILLAVGFNVGIYITGKADKAEVETLQGEIVNLKIAIGQLSRDPKDIDRLDRKFDRLYDALVRRVPVARPAAHGTHPK